MSVMRLLNWLRGRASLPDDSVQEVSGISTDDPVVADLIDRVSDLEALTKDHQTSLNRIEKRQQRAAAEVTLPPPPPLPVAKVYRPGELISTPLNGGRDAVA